MSDAMCYHSEGPPSMTSGMYYAQCDLQSTTHHDLDHTYRPRTSTRCRHGNGRSTAPISPVNKFSCFFQPFPSIDRCHPDRPHSTMDHWGSLLYHHRRRRRSIHVTIVNPICRQPRYTRVYILAAIALYGHLVDNPSLVIGSWRSGGVTVLADISLVWCASGLS